MRAHTLVAAVAGLLVPVSWQAGFHASPTPLEAPVTVRRIESEPNSLPLVMTRHYRMAGRIRPLLFWIGRDDVGLASVAWRAGAEGRRGYELLVGTDPARAPRRLNRWGYIAEQTGRSGGSLLALMTQASGGSYEDAEEQSATASGDLQAIRSEVTQGSARWQTARIRPHGDLTVHDVEIAITRARTDTAESPLRHMLVESATRSGFLVAVAELVDHVVHRSASGVKAAAVPYVFGQRAYELRLRGLRPASLTLGTRVHEARRAEFEIRNLGTDARTRFEMIVGVREDLAGVPLLIAWQPRWWLKLELHLEDGTAAGVTQGFSPARE